MSRLRKHILRKIVHNNCKLYLGHVTNCVLGSQSALECMCTDSSLSSLSIWSINTHILDFFLSVREKAAQSDMRPMHNPHL